MENIIAKEVVYEKTGKKIRDAEMNKIPYMLIVGEKEMKAVIATGGKQYKVSEGDVIRVEKLDVEAGAAYEFTEVLAISDKTLTVGKPVVKGAVVKATVLDDNAKADKVLVFKKIRRKGFQKCNGHRQLLTKIKINEIA